MFYIDIHSEMRHDLLKCTGCQFSAHSRGKDESISVVLLYVLHNKLCLLSPAAARKFFEEGVKTLEGLFFVYLILGLYDFILYLTCIILHAQ